MDIKQRTIDIQKLLDQNDLNKAVGMFINTVHILYKLPKTFTDIDFMDHFVENYYYYKSMFILFEKYLDNTDFINIIQKAINIYKKYNTKITVSIIYKIFFQMKLSLIYVENDENNEENIDRILLSVIENGYLDDVSVLIKELYDYYKLDSKTEKKNMLNLLNLVQTKYSTYIDEVIQYI